MAYETNEDRILDVVTQLDFPRVVGTNGERRGFEIIQHELAAIGTKAWFEEFTSPWLEIAEADLRVNEK